jgi:hypothetical protein
MRKHNTNIVDRLLSNMDNDMFIYLMTYENEMTRQIDRYIRAQREKIILSDNK